MLKKRTKQILARTKYYRNFTDGVKGSAKRKATADYLRSQRKQGMRKTYGPYGSGR